MTMATSATVIVDDKQFKQMVDALTGKELKRAIKSPLNKAGTRLRRGIINAMHSTPYNIGSAADKWIKKKAWVLPKQYDRSSGVRVAFSRSKNPANRAHVLRWLSEGTEQRFAYSGHKRGGKSLNAAYGRGNAKNRGRIKPTYFFARGTGEKPAEAELMQGVEQAVNKIYKKYH